MTYSFRITDRTGKQLGASPPLTSPHEVGRMACDAYTVLIGRGHDPAHLALDGIVAEDGETRPFTDAEEAAMVAALDQHLATRTDA